ncbi:hypothetical protein [Luteipulveratus mongoliensis]|uniref:DUF2846 domain-containing protein n=1 Tax=Luteipulveratus mongoliensis TaxID=571913 RepID=A0A0K1JMX6_9MICO|nr:hypothetical protein [Luteipulveratus mongoliensis]AKU18069.1 hypothetical protein VV02_23060 [Luteipulveratus mongoliensis]
MTYSEADSSPAAMADSGAEIVVHRPWRWPHAAWPFKIVIDGVLVGRLRPRQTGRYSVRPGTHIVCARIAPKAGRPIQVPVGPGETAIIEVLPSGLPATASLAGHDTSLRLRIVKADEPGKGKHHDG